MTNTPPATIHLGDCIEVMRTLPEDSVDAIVTDPPYGLGFMGKAWDELPPGEEWARECLRVLKPGGHLLAFGGSRTWHRLAVAVEDAGFEVRDSIAWLYGSGFPKSLDVSKAIDKQRTEDLEPAAAVARWLVDHMETLNVTRRDICDHFSAENIAQQWTTHWTDGAVKPRVPKWDQWQELRRWMDLPDDMDAEVWRLNGRKGTPGEAWDLRPITQAEARPLVSGEHITFDQRSSAERERRDIPATDDARKWAGFGTALKPAFEPIVVARKPLVGTVAANVLAHGTGALNIDGCRVGTSGGVKTTGTGDYTSEGIPGEVHATRGWRSGREYAHVGQGRWPANVVLDESQAAALDQMSGVSISRTGGRSTRGEASSWDRQDGGMFDTGRDVARTGHADSGGASRFFYVAKAPTRERPKVDGVAHPTVKPLALMRWLVRLVTPPGGTVLEPFAGSGTTVEACALEGFACVAIEREPDYLPLIQARLARVEAAQPEPAGPSLFDVEATA